MTANQTDIARLLRSGGGLVLAREHPHLADSLSYLVRQERLRRVLPGVYSRPDLAGEPLIRMRALAAWDSDAVLTGTAAARLTFWPEVTVTAVGAAVRHRRASQPGYCFTQRRIPVELAGRSHGLACTLPALTAVDLCQSLGGDVLDVALRSRMTTVAGLYEALRLTPGRRGNVDRQRLLLDSRDDAWSPAERHAHRLLRAEGVTGWIGNYPLPLLGVLYYLDIAFPESRLAIEIDGRAHHSDRTAFERDRWRQNDIVLAGWRVLRFTAAMLRDQPHVVVAVIRRALQQRPA